MNIEEEFVLAIPPVEAAAVLLDLQRITSCLPGVEQLEEVGPDEYRGVLAIRIGPMRPSFQGKVRIDRSRVPGRLVASAEGRDRATGSIAQVDLTATLLETADGGTRVGLSSDVRLRGKLGQFGTGVIQSTARELLAQFSSCLGRSIEGSEQAPSPAGIGLGAIGRILADYLGSLRRRLTRLVRR